MSRDEVARIASPDAALDAVIVETNGGATVAFGYDVYVVAHGLTVAGQQPVAVLGGATRSVSAYGVDARWTAARELSVDYLKADTVHLTAAQVKVGAFTVDVRLHGGIEDAAAPAGGMLYNRDDGQRPR